jgi:predicted RNA-binding protein (virulence factor B family)
MIEIGKKNQLRVLKRVDFGIYLDGGDLGEILMPVRYVPEGCKVGDVVDSFLYLDSEDRLIATTETPYVEVGGCAHLEVVAVGAVGAFMNWGLAKDLLVPFKEQRVPMAVGKSYTVYVYLDNTERIAASSRLRRFLSEENDGKFVVGQEVSLLIARRSDLGYQAVINGSHLGLIHSEEIFQPIHVGDHMDGYIKGIRPDGFINLTLNARGKASIDALSQFILDFLKAEGGSSFLTDKSPAEEIYKTFNVSKSNYKKALGKLYKEKYIMLDKERITLI